MELSLCSQQSESASGHARWALKLLGSDALLERNSQAGTLSKELTWLWGPDGPICHVVHHLHEPHWPLAGLLDTADGWLPKAMQLSAR